MGEGQALSQNLHQLRTHMLNLFWTILSVLTTALKRLRANWGLALCALVALLAAIALSVSIPVYAEGASLRLLKSTLAEQERRNNRSAFMLLFRYIGSNRGALPETAGAPAPLEPSLMSRNDRERSRHRRRHTAAGVRSAATSARTSSVVRAAMKLPSVIRAIASSCASGVDAEHASETSVTR